MGCHGCRCAHSLSDGSHLNRFLNKRLWSVEGAQKSRWNSLHGIAQGERCPDPTNRTRQVPSFRLIFCVSTFRGPRRDGGPADLGYFIGYRIVEAFHARSPDTRQAVHEIIRATDFEDLLRRSGYAAIVEQR